MEFLNSIYNQLTVILGRVGPIEIIDVVAVAFILYQLLRLVRGTQATQLIVGLAVMGMIGLAATQMHLILLGWLFQNASPIAVLAIVVPTARSPRPSAPPSAWPAGGSGR